MSRQSILRALSLSLFLGAPLLASAQPLISPAELSARLSGPPLRVVDIRDGKDDAGRTPYEAGHIAGALSAPYSKWRGPKENPGKLPSEDTLTAVIQSSGSTPPRRLWWSTKARTPPTSGRRRACTGR